MIANTATSWGAALPAAPQPAAASSPVPWLELGLITLLLAAINIPWSGGSAVARWSFWPAAVESGEWWRVFSHPFVHVSWYHLLLDGTAFGLLYASLRQRGWWRRALVVGAAAAGSLIACCWLAPAVDALGLCGLSGIAHGLMAVTSLEMIRAGERTGWIGLVAVLAKALWEACTGQVLFGFLHFGLMGTPIAVSHLGGVVGGAAAAWATGSMTRDTGIRAARFWPSWDRRPACAVSPPRGRCQDGQDACPTEAGDP